MRSLLSIGILAAATVVQKLSEALNSAAAEEQALVRYALHAFTDTAELLQFIRSNHVDCLVLQANPALQSLLNELSQQTVFLPAVIVDVERSLTDYPAGELRGNRRYSYHAAVQQLSLQQTGQIGLSIDQAISKFIQLSPESSESGVTTTVSETDALATHKSLMTQQLRLAEKLKERLGYLGVYYKRNPQNFLRHLPLDKQDELLRQLKEEYREIILVYFLNEPSLNEQIDNFVNVAFFADVPVAQIVEIHMELMDEFSKHLKLEGRSDEVLLDYRLTLIDTIAHLCEMYRRSIPRDS
ncbi:circadian clock protein KaiA [Leptolyngbya ohadii]|uniref:circadian clock protein KaiA n=1 Tax=Leptolyngbya ohadii TaxID=1962290 RepID=UPI001CED4735|nr:circadian clock protein KaiA [Leptolyngbya ohadii]